jgi:hypothetical protein
MNDRQPFKARFQIVHCIRPKAVIGDIAIKKTWVQRIRKIDLLLRTVGYRSFNNRGCGASIVVLQLCNVVNKVITDSWFSI